jgi:hypothetical protein
MKRGRKPLGRKAMTAAERQAKRRKRLRREAAVKAAAERGEWLSPHPYQPPHGYPKAKEKLIAEGHSFQRARREWGFEEGVFVDGAYLGAGEVITLADLQPAEREQRLAERRGDGKDFACDAVEGYMAAMRVSLDDLIQNRRERDESLKRLARARRPEP